MKSTLTLAKRRKNIFWFVFVCSRKIMFSFFHTKGRSGLLARAQGNITNPHPTLQGNLEVTCMLYTKMSITQYIYTTSRGHYTAQVRYTRGGNISITRVFILVSLSRILDFNYIIYKSCFWNKPKSKLPVFNHAFEFCCFLFFF